jgi:hypothetical protein
MVGKRKWLVTERAILSEAGVSVEFSEPLNLGYTSPERRDAMHAAAGQRGVPTRA